MIRIRFTLIGIVCIAVAVFAAIIAIAPLQSTYAQITCGGSSYTGASTVTVTAANSGTVWGSGPFTTDSNLATIARFLGGADRVQLSIEDGGCIGSFEGYTQNGVTTMSYTTYHGMYVSCISGCSAGGLNEVSYETSYEVSYETSYCSGSAYAGASPRTVTSTSIGTVYGNGPFRTDSSLGKIARYLGASGSATLVITNVGCTPSFSSGTSNGITTTAYNASYQGMTVSCTSGCGAACTLPWGGTIPSSSSTPAYQAASVPYGSTCTQQTRSCTNGTLSGTYTNQSCTVQAGASCTLPWGGSLASGQSTTAYQAASVPYGSSCTSQSRTCTNGTLSGTYTNQSCTVQAGAVCTLPWGGTINSGQSVTAYLTSSAAPPSSCSSQSRTCTNGTLSGTYSYQSCSVGTPGPSATAAPGDTVRVYWAATNGWSYSSTYSVNQTDACGNTGGVNYAWTANTGSGSSDIVIAACQAGRTYTYTYRVTNSAGFQVTSSATITVTAPTSCVLSVSPNPIYRGQNASLSWTSINATSGTISPGSINASPVSGGSVSVAPNATTTYTGSFTGTSGTIACTPTTLNVQCAPIYSCSGQQIQYTNAGCTTVNVGTACVSPMVCVPGQSTCQALNPIFNASGNRTGHLEASPQLVRKGTSSKLYWNVSNVNSCTVTGNNGDSFSGGCASNTCTSGSGGRTTATISSTVLYTLSCTTGGAPLAETVSVLPSPEYNEQ